MSAYTIIYKKCNCSVCSLVEITNLSLLLLIIKVLVRIQGFIVLVSCLVAFENYIVKSECRIYSYLKNRMRKGKFCETSSAEYSQNSFYLNYMYSCIRISYRRIM